MNCGGSDGDSDGDGDGDGDAHADGFATGRPSSLGFLVALPLPSVLGITSHPWEGIGTGDCQNHIISCCLNLSHLFQTTNFWVATPSCQQLF